MHSNNKRVLNTVSISLRINGDRANAYYTDNDTSIGVETISMDALGAKVLMPLQCIKDYTIGGTSRGKLLKVFNFIDCDKDATCFKLSWFNEHTHPRYETDIKPSHLLPSDVVKSVQTIWTSIKKHIHVTP